MSWWYFPLLEIRAGEVGLQVQKEQSSRYASCPRAVYATSTSSSGKRTLARTSVSPALSSCPKARSCTKHDVSLPPTKISLNLRAAHSAFAAAMTTLFSYSLPSASSALAQASCVRESASSHICFSVLGGECTTRNGRAIMPTRRRRAAR